MTLTAAPPPVTTSRWRRTRPALVTAAGLGLATAALRLRDPHQHGSWGLCPFKGITGWDCPFCGGLRATNDLTHGDLAAAWHSNALFIASIPVLAALWLWWLSRSWRGASASPPARAVRIATGVGVVLVVAFAVYRNTPWGSAFYVS